LHNPFFNDYIVPISSLIPVDLSCPLDLAPCISEHAQTIAMNALLMLISYFLFYTMKQMIILMIVLTTMQAFDLLVVWHDGQFRTFQGQGQLAFRKYNELSYMYAKCIVSTKELLEFYGGDYRVDDGWLRNRDGLPYSKDEDHFPCNMA
jgi:hypothetical protein